jgi:hypothetical protein
MQAAVPHDSARGRQLSRCAVRRLQPHRPQKINHMTSYAARFRRHPPGPQGRRRLAAQRSPQRRKGCTTAQRAVPNPVHRWPSADEAFELLRDILGWLPDNEVIER